MDITVQGRHIEVTDSIRQFVETKVGKLERYLDSLQSIEVILGKEADKATVEIVVTARKKNTFVAADRHDDMYTCIDQCLHKVAEQLRRHKDKVKDRQGPSHGQSMESPQ